MLSALLAFLIGCLVLAVVLYVVNLVMAMITKLGLARVLSDGFCERISQRPSTFESLVNSLDRKASSFGPRCQAHSLSRKGNQFVTSPISLLFLGSHPATIARMVLSIVVNSVNGMFSGRPRTHIGIEVEEAISSEPTFTHGNSSSSVTSIIRSVPVVTTSN